MARFNFEVYLISEFTKIKKGGVIKFHKTL